MSKESYQKEKARLAVVIIVLAVGALVWFLGSWTSGSRDQTIDKGGILGEAVVGDDQVEVEKFVSSLNDHELTRKALLESGLFEGIDEESLDWQFEAKLLGGGSLDYEFRSNNKMAYEDYKVLYSRLDKHLTKLLVLRLSEAGNEEGAELLNLTLEERE